MKLKSAGGVILCVLALASLAVLAQVKPSDPTAPKKPESVEPQKLDVPGFGIEVLRISPGIDRKWKGLITLGDRIKEDIAALEESFARGNLKELIGLLAIRHAVVSGFDYELKTAGDSFGFWKAVRTPGSRLELRVVSAYVSNVPGPHARLPISSGTPPVRPPAGKPQYDAVAFVAMEIHVISKPKPGDPMHNDTYFMDLGYRHQWCCVWGDEEVCLPPI